MQPITAKQLRNLQTHGFLDIEIASETGGKVMCSVGKDGKPDLEYIKCTQEQADELAEHMRNIGWRFNRSGVLT